jgi:hypothetical protein
MNFRLNILKYILPNHSSGNSEADRVNDIGRSKRLVKKTQKVLENELSARSTNSLPNQQTTGTIILVSYIMLPWPKLNN